MLFMQDPAQRIQDKAGTLTAEQSGGFLLHQLTDGTLPALAGNAGTLHVAEQCCFGRAEIVTVEAGHRDRLEDMQFEMTHGVFSFEKSQERGCSRSMPKPKALALPIP